MTNELNYISEDDILNMKSVPDLIMALKIKQIKEVHPYAITAPTDASKYWTTYYRTEGGARKLIRGKSEKELLIRLVELYDLNTRTNQITYKELFEEWLAYKEPRCNSVNTIRRHIQHYNKYFLNSDISNKKICKITTDYLEEFCNNLIRNFCLSQKEWTNVKTIILGMFNYAKRKKYLTTSPFDDVIISIKFKQISRKSEKTQVFNTKELADLLDYLDEMYEKTHDAAYLAVKVNFYLGLRVGELVALTPMDIEDNQLRIHCEEIRNQYTGEYSVVEHTKTNTERRVYLVPAAKEILDKIQAGTYLFERDGKRLTSRQINYVLEKYAKDRNTTIKSSHKIRKTYASNLCANGVPLECIRKQLGHSNILTTTKYIYSPATEEDERMIIANALSRK